jgi:hypothetical protein
MLSSTLQIAIQRALILNERTVKRLDLLIIVTLLVVIAVGSPNVFLIEGMIVGDMTNGTSATGKVALKNGLYSHGSFNDIRLSNRAHGDNQVVAKKGNNYVFYL